MMQEKKNQSSPQDNTSKPEEKGLSYEAVRWIDQLLAALQEINKAAQNEKVDKETIALLTETAYNELKKGPIDPAKYESG